MKILKLVWFYFEKVGLIIGNFITGVVMTIFYFTIFPFFAIPFKLLTDVLGVKSTGSKWINKQSTAGGINDFKNEF